MNRILTMTGSFSRVFIRYTPIEQVQIVSIAILRFAENTDLFIKQGETF